ncbi:MAG: ATP-binding cassette domain-containing protein [Lactobacillaceae bacterium]|jgi:ABC-type multidrug transport system ATPase subunit|nr:ATP-binding cassette domain-containing protein [Lactobacillaceae bacterium]
MLKIKDLSVTFSKNKVLQNVNYIFKENQFYLIQARNGSGKSTLLNAIFSLVPFQGSIESTLPKKDVFYLPNDYEFDEVMKGREYLEYIKYIWQSDVEIDPLVEELNMTEYINRRVGGYSLGMRKMLMTALYMVSDTDCWFVDELNNGLDEVNLEILVTLLQNEMTKSNKMIVFVTHQPADLEEIDSIKLTLKGGELIEQAN